MGRRRLLNFNSFLDSLASDGYDHALKVECNGKTEQGFLRQLERGDDGKIVGVILNHTERLKRAIERRGTDNFPLKQIYVSFNSDIRITEYDSDRLRNPKKTRDWLIFILGIVSFLFLHWLVIVISILIP